ncbi:MAG: SpoIIE family protein phosphatase [Phycisphaerae bacterium]|nr:SpoIIE family protein phosphatase [Phycisphaerae bacterium]NUQ45595.1 SpoIIE family protein phosphatase [Phycisphaerae bacterium]
MAELRIHFSDGRVENLPIGKRHLVLGRDPDCDIVIDDPLTSRRHARIYQTDDERLFVEDCHSKNGTTVNDQPVSDPVRLNEGDRVGIGSCYLVVRTGSSPTVILSDPEIKSSSESVWSPTARLDLSKQRLERLYDLYERLSGRFERDDLMNEVVEASMEVLGLERAGLALWAGDPTPPRWVVVKNLRADAQGEVRISRTLVERALYNGERILINDPVRDMPTPTTSMISNHICSAMVVPLVYHNKVQGALYGDRITSAVGYTKEDIDFFASLGRLAAMGLVNVQLLEELQSRYQMENQLMLARQIQNRLFPSEPLSCGGVTVDAINDPGRQVSGDYFDYFERPDGRITVVIADVSGKGVPAALLMANLQAAVHVTLLEGHELVPAMQRLNKLICQNVDSERFITGVFGIVDPKTRTFHYVNVGHPRPLHLRAGNYMVEVPEPSALPLGVETDIVHEEVVFPMGDGSSTIFLYTDGVPDAQNDKEEFFGQERLETLLRANSGEPPRDLIQKIRRHVQQFIRHNKQFDDITMMAIHVD